jgi:hypothetical protein
MIYRARTSKAVSAWIADRRGAWSGRGLREARDLGVDQPRAHCPGFHLYRGFVGCPAWVPRPAMAGRDGGPSGLATAGQPCSYCFLRTTFRTDPELREGVAWGNPLADCQDCHRQEEDGSCRVPECGIPIDVSAARAAVEKWLIDQKICGYCGGLGHEYCRPHVPCHSCHGKPGRRQLLNAGELADSLAFPPEENPHIGMLLDLFSDAPTNPHGHKLLLVTKAENARPYMAGRGESANVIWSWSIGNQEAEEPGMPGPANRLEDAVACSFSNRRVRLRMDPLAPDAAPFGPIGWYAKYVGEFIFDTPIELITLGTLRHRGGRPKLPAQERASIYRAALEGLRAGGYDGPVGLCKETPEMIRDVLGIEPESMRCNCLP